MAIIHKIFEDIRLDPQELLLATLEQQAEGVIVANADGDLIYVNTAAELIHGVSTLYVSPEEYTATYDLLTIDGEPYPTRQLPLSRTVLDGATVENARWKIRRPDGHIVDAVGTSRPVKDASGRQIASVLTIKDDTAAVAARNELAKIVAAQDNLVTETRGLLRDTLSTVSAVVHWQAQNSADMDSRSAMLAILSRINILTDIQQRMTAFENGHRLEAVKFLGDLALDTIKSVIGLRHIDVSMDRSGEALLSLDQATSAALAVNEVILHALRRNEGKMDCCSVAVSGSPDELRLRFSDADVSFADQPHPGSVPQSLMLADHMVKRHKGALTVIESDMHFGALVTFPL